MTEQEKTNFLMNNYDYKERTAIAYVEAKGICCYCKEDVFCCRQGYSSSEVDHVLPKSKYPELEYDQNNLVFSCSSCNGMKGEFDPYESLSKKGVISSSPKDALKNNRYDLIREVEEFLADKIKNRKMEYQAIKKIVQEE